MLLFCLTTFSAAERRQAAFPNKKQEESLPTSWGDAASGCMEMEWLEFNYSSINSCRNSTCRKGLSACSGEAQSYWNSLSSLLKCLTRVCKEVGNFPPPSQRSDDLLLLRGAMLLPCIDIGSVHICSNSRRDEAVSLTLNFGSQEPAKYGP